MGSEAVILLTHAAATWFLVGLIWIVQVVHYPLFSLVGADGYVAYQRSHMSRITWIVAPAMFVELFVAAAAVWVLGSALSWIGAALLAGVWGSTFLLQVPLHGRLIGGFDANAHRLLVMTNWLRTALWSARGGVALLMLGKISL